MKEQTFLAIPVIGFLGLGGYGLYSTYQVELAKEQTKQAQIARETVLQKDGVICGHKAEYYKIDGVKAVVRIDGKEISDYICK